MSVVANPRSRALAPPQAIESTVDRLEAVLTGQPDPGHPPPPGWSVTGRVWQEHGRGIFQKMATPHGRRFPASQAIPDLSPHLVLQAFQFCMVFQLCTPRRFICKIGAPPLPGDGWVRLAGRPAKGERWPFMEVGFPFCIHKGGVGGSGVSKAAPLCFHRLISFAQKNCRKFGSIILSPFF